MTAAPPALTLDARRQAQALLRGWSIEVSCRDSAALAEAAGHVPPGTDVYLNWIDGDTHHRMVAAAAALHSAGLKPVPHVAVRYLASFTQLQDFLARLAGDAGVNAVLLIGGDRERPIGPFDSSQQALETGLFEKHGIARVGIAAYPEGNPRISPAAVDAALAAKLDYARKAGLAAQVVTQFCFEAEPIAAWLRRLRQSGVTAPVRIGLAGPASITTLMKYALRCGIGNSTRALGIRGTAIARLLTESGPERVIHDLARLFAEDKPLRVDGLHFFSFGGFARTADWARAAQAG